MVFADEFAQAPAASARNAAPMLYVSLLIEALRAHPRLMFWIAALSQAAVWTLVPAIFYASPPGEVPLVLAVGREWQLGSPYGPPLAYWLAEMAFSLAGQRPIGLYLLSQICVVTTFWAVFALGRSILGTAHALMAVLLMVGIISFSVPTPEFGPSVLATPMTALALLFYWRAVGEGRRGYWYALAVALSVLTLTTYSGLLLAALIVAFTGSTARGRATLDSMDPWAAAGIAVLVMVPHLAWLEWSGKLSLPSLADLPDLRMAEGRYPALLRLVVWLLVAHAGLVVLIVVAGGLRLGPRPAAPTFVRRPVDPLARAFVYFFALAPAGATLLLAVLFGYQIPIGRAAPLVVLSGLATILAAGDSISLYRQRSLGLAWLALLIVPAAVTLAGTVLAPWIAAADLSVGRPAADMGQFFTDNFRRRTGKPLEIVIGDLHSAGLVALASPDRPHLYIDGSPERAPWLNDEEVRRRGAVLIWPTQDAAGAPPAHLAARFPEIVPEVPRAFERPVQGRLPLFRLGWAVIRPRGESQPNVDAPLRGTLPPAQ